MRVAWRNAAKCIGRIAWNTLIVRDCRHVTDPGLFSFSFSLLLNILFLTFPKYKDGMFAEILEHNRIATNGGSLEAVMTVFRPRGDEERWGPRFWNMQIVRYACYEVKDENGYFLFPPNPFSLFSF